MQFARFHKRDRSASRRATLCLLICLAMVIALAATAQAQSRFNRTSLADLGLARAWSTQTSSAQGTQLHANLHLSADRHIQVFDLVTADGTRSFAEGTAGPRGRIMTRAEAERQADIALRTLKLDGIEAQVEPRSVPELTLVVQSPSGRVEALDAETGRIKWQLALGNPSHSGYAPAANDTYAAAISGSTLQVAEIATGKLALKKGTSNIPGGGPILTEKYAMVPLYRGAMEVFPIDPEEAKRGSSYLKSFGQPTAAPIEVDGMLAWPTDRGAVYFADAVAVDDLFRIRTRSRIVGQVAFASPSSYFVGTEDSYLICIDARQRAIVWDLLVGAPCAGTPYVLGDAVFIVDRETGLHCVDWQAGAERWTKNGVREIVTGLDGRLYCRLTTGQLATIDAASGDVLATTHLPSQAQVIPNALTDRLYFAINGRISCYRDQEHPWPTVYGRQMVTEAAEPSVEAGPESVAATEEGTTDEASENPFGAEDTMADDDDPFGTSDADDDPFGAGGETDDNPFGSDSGDDDPFGGTDDDDPFGF